MWINNGAAIVANYLINNNIFFTLGGSFSPNQGGKGDVDFNGKDANFNLVGQAWIGNVD